MAWVFVKLPACFGTTGTSRIYNSFPVFQCAYLLVPIPLAMVLLVIAVAFVFRFVPAAINDFVAVLAAGIEWRGGSNCSCGSGFKAFCPVNTTVAIV
jgi:hypothetical protein